MDTVLVTQYSNNVINNDSKEDVESGKIHSIFASSLNLKFDFGLVNIIKEEYQKLPFSIEIEEEILNSILEKCSIGDNVRLDKIKNALIFEDAKIEILFVSTPYNYVLESCEIDEINFKDSFGIVEEFINKCRTQNGFGVSNKLFLEMVKEVKHKDEVSRNFENEFIEYIDKMLHFVNIYTSKKICANNETIKKDIFDYFIGRGKGLTPSGDDLILGIVSMLKVVNKDNISKDLLSYLEEYGIKRTTDISLEYLKYGCSGSVGKNIKTTCEGLINLDCNIVKYLDKLSKKGHSSGIDTILGIYLAMIIINNQIKGEIGKWDIQMIY